MSQIDFQGVMFRSDEQTILQNITFSVSKGEFLSIVGPSGSGKSTLLRMCCHLISPSAGHIRINDRDVLQWDPVALRRKAVYCFQTPVLFGKTVEETLRFPSDVRKQTFDRERAIFLLTRFQLEKDCLGMPVEKLSGGEKQRIALVRALLCMPEILLLDEPTAALDAENTGIVERSIETLHEEGITVLWVTHDDAQSRRYAGRRLTIEKGRLKLQEVFR